MCGTCGCSADGAATSPEQTAGSAAPREMEGSRTVDLEAELLGKNDAIAGENRAAWMHRHTVAINVMGGPGAGKTSLLEASVAALAGTIHVVVVEGDQATSHDRDRIRRAGCAAVQVNTGAGCHLDAEMVAGADRELGAPSDALLLIENVGNLVCPSLFDLGERARVVVMSVTEGEDKPLKYPHMFRDAEVLVVSKTDLLPHLAFDLDRCLEYARQVNPRLTIFQISATRGDGLSAWTGWLTEEIEAARTHGDDHGAPSHHAH